MKPDLGDPFDPNWGGVPAQMSSNDHQIWMAFRDMAAIEYKNLYFSVHVGEPTLWQEDLEEEMTRMVEYSSRRRIDVVGEKDDAWDILELRMNAGPGALGSVLLYKLLWEQDPPDERPVNPIIVTDVTDTNLLYAAEKLGIRLLVV